MAAGRWNGKQSRTFGVGFYTKYGDGGVDLSPLPI
jgi:hypothetical protein